MNLISNLPIETGDAVIFALSLVLLTAGVFLSFRPVFCSVLPTYLALLLGHLSGLITLSEKDMIFWGVATVITLIIFYMLPGHISRSRYGQIYLGIGTFAGAMTGATMSNVSAIIIASILGFLFGCLVYYRSKSSFDMRTDQRKFWNYLLAKGFPLIINLVMTGIYIAILASRFSKV